MSEFLNDKELQAFEGELKALLPAMPAINRDELLFRAGQRSAQRRQRFLAMSSVGLFTCLVIVSSALLWQVLSARERIKIVYRDRPIPAAKVNEEAVAVVPPALPLAPRGRGVRGESAGQEAPRAAYLQMRAQMLRWGVDGLPGVPRVSSTHQPGEETLALHTGVAGSLLERFGKHLGEKE